MPTQREEPAPSGDATQRAFQRFFDACQAQEAAADGLFLALQTDAELCRARRTAHGRLFKADDDLRRAKRSPRFVVSRCRVAAHRDRNDTRAAKAEQETAARGAEESDRALVQHRARIRTASRQLSAAELETLRAARGAEDYSPGAAQELRGLARTRWDAAAAATMRAWNNAGDHRTDSQRRDSDMMQRETTDRVLRILSGTPGPRPAFYRPSDGEQPRITVDRSGRATATYLHHAWTTTTSIDVD